MSCLPGESLQNPQPCRLFDDVTLAVFLLSTFSTTSGVFAGSLSPLPSSAMPWIEFALSLCTCLFCVLLGVGTLVKKLVYRRKLLAQTCASPVANKFVHQQLGIEKDWFEEVTCYCRRCWGLANFPNSQTRGGKKYALPRLWTRFALPPVRSAKVRGLDKWHVAYHGTSGLSAKAIVESQRMLMPGDRRPDGGYIEIRPGHVEKDAHATNVFMSPSVIYVSCPFYSVEHDCEAQEGGKNHRVLVALELLIQPETYEVGPETIGAREADVQIDPLFSNQELEWFTNRRGVIEVGALLVKVVEE